MAERLTREQMAQKYPNTWLGLVNIKYANDDGVTLEAADIIYTDKTEDEGAGALSPSKSGSSSPS